VGKSTFTNYLLGKELMETGEIREDDSKGHHTTTHRQLFVMDNGARIIDTPGMRELGMWIVDDGIDFSFTDINDLIIQCRFSNCTHKGEPGCAVAQALKEGTLTEKRWKNYCKIQKESKFQAAKESRKQAVVKKKSNKKSRGEW
jgi:ribosome biogenesis GTPase